VQEEHHRPAPQAHFQNAPRAAAVGENLVARIPDANRAGRAIGDAEILKALIHRMQHVGRPIDKAGFSLGRAGFAEHLNELLASGERRRCAAASAVPGIGGDGSS
jgi:hypothetical protein